MIALPKAEFALAPPAGDAPERASFAPSSFGAVVRRFFRVQWTFFICALALLAQALGLRRLGFALVGRSKAYEKLTGPVALRRAFETLGPTYIKLGQMIASGDGLFPERYSEEFRKCLDAVPPFGFDAVVTTLSEELGRPHGEVFATLDEKPAAAASIAQVHFATLPSGEEVVVKVQRPKIEELMRADVALMRFYARVLAAVVPRLDLANPVGIVDDLATTLAEELDFRGEARNMNEFNAIMARADNADVAAPVPMAALTTRRVLTMERFRGLRVDDTARILASGVDGATKLLVGIRGWFQCMLIGGFFHGDVHAGNFMMLDDGRVGFLDFGIVGRFDDEKKRMIFEYVTAFQSRDFARLGEVLVKMGSVDAAEVDTARFTSDLAAAFAPMVEADSTFRMRDIVPGMLRVAVRHKMRMPREFVLVTKQLVYLDRYAKALGGPTMNVLTDPRVLSFLMEDAGRFWG